MGGRNSALGDEPACRRDGGPGQRWRRTGCLLAAGLLQACTTPPPTYRVGPGGPELTRAAAEQALVQTALRAQVVPPLDAPLQLLAAPLPDYPPGLRNGDAARDGTVRLRFRVGPDGRVSDLTALRTPSPELARLAMEAVRLWRFTPPQRDGQPVTLWFDFSIVFKLID